jgi:Peptidase A4 family
MRRVGPQGMALVSRWPRALTIITVTAGALVMALAAVPGPGGAGAAVANAVPLAASGRVPLRPQSTSPAKDGSSARPGGLRSHLPLVVHGGRPIPPTWPRPAPIEATSGHLPSSISDSLPSANWAGYEDTGTGAQFTEVTGSWVVPTVAENSYGDSSTWVGIDGIESQGDLVQAGTDQSWSASGALYYAWYELLPQASVELGLVYPGDHITVKIDEVQTGTWTISVDDLTQATNWTNSVTYSAPGTSAEWVEEAPTLSYDDSVETLADFGTVAFSNMAVEGPGTGSATGSPIYMVNESHIIAYPTQYDPTADSFSVVYGTPSSTPGSGQAGVPIAPPSSSTGATGTTTTTTSPVTSNSQGLWLAGKNGGIFALGTAKFHGSTGNIRLQRQITGIAPTADHGGYWMVASDGGLFAFGDAGFEGSVPASGIGPVGSKSPDHLVAPIVGIVPTSNGKGYLMVASDGGVFAFGNAHFAGSCASIGGCPAPVVAVVPDASGNGYWLLLSNCNMVSFGGAPSSATAPSFLKGTLRPSAPEVRGCRPTRTTRPWGWSLPAMGAAFGWWTQTGP